MLDGDEVY
jgi:hypothetical protein